jgi:hypothetical protein
MHELDQEEVDIRERSPELWEALVQFHAGVHRVMELLDEDDTDTIALVLLRLAHAQGELRRHLAHQKHRRRSLTKRKIKAIDRQQRVLQLYAQRIAGGEDERDTIRSLGAQFDVSEKTIRRDLSGI